MQTRHGFREQFGVQEERYNFVDRYGPTESKRIAHNYGARDVCMVREFHSLVQTPQRP